MSPHRSPAAISGAPRGRRPEGALGVLNLPLAVDEL